MASRKRQGRSSGGRKRKAVTHAICPYCSEWIRVALDVLSPRFRLLCKCGKRFRPVGSERLSAERLEAYAEARAAGRQ